MNGAVLAVQFLAIGAGLALLARHVARNYGLRFSLCARTTVCALGVALGLQLALAYCGLAGWPATVVLACSAICAATDFENGHVFDAVLLASAFLLLAPVRTTGALIDDALGAAAGGILLLVPFVLSRGRGMGLGDVKFAALLGLGLSAGDAVRAIWLACVIGGAVAVALLLTRRLRHGCAMPFAPFLALGSGVVLVWHP